jgi:hypothetical protein
MAPIVLLAVLVVSTFDGSYGASTMLTTRSQGGAASSTTFPNEAAKSNSNAINNGGSSSTTMLRAAELPSSSTRSQGSGGAAASVSTNPTSLLVAGSEPASSAMSKVVQDADSTLTTSAAVKQSSGEAGSVAVSKQAAQASTTAIKIGSSAVPTSGQRQSSVVVPRTSAKPSVFPSVFSGIVPSTTPTAEEVTRHIQVAFANNYTGTIAQDADLGQYCDALVPSIALAASVVHERIAETSVMSQTGTDRVVLRFSVLPTTDDSLDCLSSLSSSCGASVESATLKLSDLVSSASLRLNDTNANVLTIDQESPYRNFRNFWDWTDNGPCPTTSCNSRTQVCDCTDTGTFYCRDIKKDKKDLSLLALLVLLLLIPIVVIAVYLAYKYRERKEKEAADKKNERRMVRADMLSYHEYVSRDLDKQQPKLATIESRSTVNDTTLAGLYKSLGENVSIAYNGTSYGGTVASSLSPVNASTVSGKNQEQVNSTNEHPGSETSGSSEDCASTKSMIPRKQIDEENDVE